MKNKLNPCRYCKCQKAETFKVGDLWYVRCKGTKKAKNGELKKCTGWSPYEFLGFNEDDAVNNWNDRN